VRQFDGRVTLVAKAVASETGRYVETLRTVAATAGGYEPLSATHFAQITSP
jgi:hypothetical protein